MRFRLTSPNICAIIKKTIREQTFLADRALCGVADRVGSGERAALKSPVGNSERQSVVCKKQEKGVLRGFPTFTRKLGESRPIGKTNIRWCFFKVLPGAKQKHIHRKPNCDGQAHRRSGGHPPTELAAVRCRLKNECHGR